MLSIVHKLVFISWWFCFIWIVALQQLRGCPVAYFKRWLLRTPFPLQRRTISRS